MYLRILTKVDFFLLHFPQSKAWISPCLTFKLTPSRTETTPNFWLFQSSQLGIHFYIFHTTEVILAH
jgi:hypothetical protein